MRITNWKKFNESVNEEFTEEMAQEIIYCFSENSYLGGDLKGLSDDFFNALAEIDIDGHQHFGMYETEYDEMKEMVRDLYGFAQTESLTFRDDMIKLYHEIRKVKAKFPEVYEIEDLFLTFIESNKFYFYLDYVKPYSGDSMNYQIRLWAQHGSSYTMEDFHKFCDNISSLVKIFSHPSIKMFIRECKYYYFEYNNKSSIEFDIIIK